MFSEGIEKRHRALMCEMSSDLLENEYTNWFEGAEYESNVDIRQIWHFFIENLDLGKLVLKLQSFWIYLKICTWANLKVIKTNMTAI